MDPLPVGVGNGEEAHIVVAVVDVLGDAWRGRPSAEAAQAGTCALAPARPVPAVAVAAVRRRGSRLAAMAAR